MSLATRCTQCGTIFKVVQDQLKVSEGWVRCGRCHEVFNALEGLFDLERDPPPARRQAARPSAAAAVVTQAPVAPPPPPPPPEPQPPEPPAAPPSWEATAPISFADLPPAAQTSPGAATPRGVADDLPAFLLKPRVPAPPAAVEAADEPQFVEEPAPEPVPPVPAQAVNSFAARHPLAPPSTEVPSTHEDDALDSRWLMSPSRDERAASERLNREAHTDDFADAQFPQDVNEDLAEAGLADGTAAQSTASAARKVDSGRRKGRGGGRKGGKRPLPADAPDFVKRAERRAQWRHPLVRATLASVALVLAGLLVLQGAFHFKDLLAARWPQTQPALEAMCRVAGCEIGPLLQNDALTVESYKVSKPAAATSPAGSDVYRLTLVLHNKADYPVAAPHVELTLKDAGDVALSRRALALSEFGYKAPTLPSNGYVELQLLFASSSPVDGYDVGIFYP
ncbi:MAG: DUF3426 domain-containing protein [Aquabacterium sp.]|nr:MAG: DUF3426 domain-containing protein [Aquabacterium sp.]